MAAAPAETSLLRRELLTPRYWPSWLGVALLRLLALLPWRLQCALGALLGALLYRLSPRRRRIAAVNLRLCFPELGEAARERLLRAHFRSLGIGFAESAAALWRGNAALGRLGEVAGLEHLHAALAAGRGVILLTGHFTHMELCAHLLSAVCGFDAMYRPMKNRLMDTLVLRARLRRGHHIFPRDDSRAMLRNLKEGHAVWYGPDQDYGIRHGVWATFFGVPAATVTATARIARASGAAVLPYVPRRLPDGRYRVELLPPLAGYPGGEPLADAQRINDLIEGWARQAPEQYLWIHRRFKNRPPGAAAVY